MKYLLLSFLFLVGCNANYKNIQYGDKVKITSGMYEGCVGYAVDTFTWLTPCEYDFLITHIQCPKGNPTDRHISICDLEKEK